MTSDRKAVVRLAEAVLLTLAIAAAIVAAYGFSVYAYYSRRFDELLDERSIDLPVDLSTASTTTTEFRHRMEPFDDAFEYFFLRSDAEEPDPELLLGLEGSLVIRDGDREALRFSFEDPEHWMPKGALIGQASRLPDGSYTATIEILNPAAAAASEGRSFRLVTQHTFCGCKALIGAIGGLVGGLASMTSFGCVVAVLVIRKRRRARSAEGGGASPQAAPE